MPIGATAESPVLIIGAGVAGLVLAQGLRLRSIPFRVFERHSRTHRSQGHRFRISKEGVSELQTVLSPQLQTLWHQTAARKCPSAPRYVDAAKLEYPVSAPADLDAAPVDRAWIRMLTLLDIDDAVEYDKEFESYDVIGATTAPGADAQVQVKFTDGTVATGRLLVGADGIKSRVRKQLQPSRRLLDLERWVVWGRTPLTEALKEELPPDMLTWCMYLDAEANIQVVVEPMEWTGSTRQTSDGRLPDVADYIYWVVCTAPRQYSETLPTTADENRRYLERTTETWHPALRRLLSQSAAHDMSACAPVWSSKPGIELQSAEPTGLVTLIGDAAHPMSPMGGSGADTAIRNAADLARSIAEEGTRGESIRKFEARMEDRAREKIEHSFRGGEKFWRGKKWTEYHEVPHV